MSVFDDVTSKSYARVTGALYLLIAVAGIYAIAFAPTQYHVEGDALATLVAVSENRAFFISGIFGDVVMMVAEILVTVLLFYMFRAVQPVLSAAAALARIGRAGRPLLPKTSPRHQRELRKEIHLGPR